MDGFPTSQLMRTRGTENEWALYCCKAQPVVNDSLKRKRSCVRRRLQQGTTAERDTNCPQASGSCVAFFEASKKAVLGDQKEAADSTCYKKDIQDAERDEEHHYIKQHMKTTVGKVYEEDKQALQEAICHVQQCKERRDLLAIQSAEQVAYEADRAEFAAAAQAAERDWQKAKHKEKQSKAKLVKSKDALLQDLHAIRESRAEGMDSTDPNACKLEMMNHAKQLRDGGYAKHPVLAIHLLRWHKKAPNEAWVLQVDPWMNLNMRGGMTNMEIQFIDLEDDEQKKADDTLTTLLAEHLMKHDTEIQMDCFAYECNDRFRELILEKMEEDDQTTLQDEFKKRVNSDVRTVKTLRSNKDQLDCFQVTDDFHLGENPDYMRHVIDAFNKKYRNDKIIVDDNEDGDESNDVWSDLPRLKRLVKKADELHTVQQDAMQVDEADKGTVAAPEPMDEVKPSDSDDNNTDDDLYGRGSEDDDGVEVTGKASHRSVKRLAEHSDDNARACKIMKVAERSGSVATSHDESADSSQSDLQQLHAQSNPRQLLYYNEQLMSTYFKKVDKIEVPVVGCGRCFYWAIQHALYWSSAEGRKLLLKSCKGTVMGMRKLMVEHANVPENSRADFTTQWKQKLLDPQNTTYATDLEIQTLATVMNIDIYVHDEGYIHEANALDSEGRDSSFYDSLKTTIIKADSASTEESKVSVHIMKKMNAHFNALVPAGKEEKAYRSNTYNWSNPEAANHVNGIDHMEWDLSPQHLSITHR